MDKEKEDKDKFQTIGRDILFYYFTEINENTMKVFNWGSMKMNSLKEIFSKTERIKHLDSGPLMKKSLKI